MLRHGRTPLTEAGRFSGRGGQDPALSESGEQDAARAAAAVVGLGRAGALFADLPPVSAVISSPMQRARQTAAAVTRQLRDVAGVDIEVTIDDDWIETGFGIWDGLTYAELLQDYAQDLDRWQGSTSFAPPDGDSLDDVAQRVRAAQTRAVASFPEQTILVATHATPVRVVLADALDAGAAALWRIRVSAGSLSVVRYWADGGIEVVTANATAHLVQKPC